MFFRRVLIRFAIVFVLCGSFAWLTYRLHGYPRTGIDDADIALVYASHLAHGQGLVYNAGGEHVEGFTSALWVLICALMFKISSAPETYLRLLSVALIAAAHAAVTLYLDGLGPAGSGNGDAIEARGRPATQPFISSNSVLYLGLVCASPAYFTWMTITVMDVCLWGVLILFSALYVLDEPETPEPGTPIGLCLLIGLLALTRPEALALCPAIIAIRAIRLFARSSARAVLRSSFGPSLVFAGTEAALLLFRLRYFGYPLPNTYYAKVSPSFIYNVTTGAHYLSAYLSSSPIVVVSLFVIFMSVWYSAARTLSRSAESTTGQRSLVLLPGPVETTGAFIAVLLLLPVLSGGDHFLWFRFYQPVYPLLILGLVCVWAEAKNHLRMPLTDARTSRFWNDGAIAVALGFAFLIAPLGTSWLGLRKDRPLAPEFTIAATERQAGADFSETFLDFPAKPSIGVVVAGGFKRTYSGPVIDLVGLNNIAMGHSPGDRVGPKNHAAFNTEVFFQLLPDILLPHVGKLPTVSAEAGLWELVYLKGLDHDPRFQSLYIYGWIHPKSSKQPTWMVGYFKKTFMNSLEQSGRYDVLLPDAGVRANSPSQPPPDNVANGLLTRNAIAQ